MQGKRKLQGKRKIAALVSKHTLAQYPGRFSPIEKIGEDLGCQ
jgi:hypothetical protein